MKENLRFITAYVDSTKVEKKLSTIILSKNNKTFEMY